MIVTSTAVFSLPDSSQQPHFHAQSNVHQCNNALQKTQPPKPRDNRNSQRSVRAEKKKNRKQQERDREREGGRVHDHRSISNWTVRWKTEKNKKEIKRAKNSHENGPLSPPTPKFNSALPQPKARQTN